MKNVSKWTLLFALGALSTIGLAGCSGGGSTDENNATTTPNSAMSNSATANNAMANNAMANNAAPAASSTP